MRLRRPVGVKPGSGVPCVVLLLVAMGSGAYGQSPQTNAEVPFASSAEIEAAGTRAAASTGAVSRLLPDGVYQYFVAARNQPAAAEIHRQWSDVTVIRSGTGILRTGHTIGNQREISPGEWRGDIVENSIERQLGAGDLVVIPAGMAHQFTPTGNIPLVYVTVKIPVDVKK